MKLSSNQRKFLEALANRIDPVIRIGKMGLESKIVSSVKEAFKTHELIKIKILETAPVTKEEVVEAVLKDSGAALIKVIGRVIIIYKTFDDKPPVIQLPASNK